MSQSTFAKRMLEKQGWKEGDGLGKKRDGISKPIKVNLKTDKTGVGHDPGSDFTDHWWLRVFNNAASSISKTNEALEIPEKPTSNLYKGFRKGTVLNQGKEEKDTDCSSEDETGQSQDSSHLPTLDDIHKFCGGATGHRAATLGIKMKGKLLRTAEQERLFNEKMKNPKDCGTTDNLNGDTVEKTLKRNKKKRKKNTETEEDTLAASFEGVMEDELTHKCQSENEDCGIANGDIVGSENVQTEKKRKKKKKRKMEEEEQSIDNESLEDTTSRKKKKRLNKEDNLNNSVILEMNTESMDAIEVPKHKKKKHKD